MGEEFSTIPSPTTYKFTVYFDNLSPDQTITHIKTRLEYALADQFNVDVSMYELCWRGSSSSVTFRLNSLQTKKSLDELEDGVGEVCENVIGNVGRAVCVDTLP